MQSLKVTVPATSYPVTLAEANQYARIDTTADDALVTTLIYAATSAAEEYLKRALITQTLVLTLDLPSSPLNNSLGDGWYDLPISVLYGELPRVIPLPKAPIQSITSVKTYDTSNTLTTYDNSNYFLDANGARLVLNNTAVPPSNMRQLAACEITYVAGWISASFVPAPIKMAILMHIQSMYDNRGVCELPSSCKALLDQFKIYGM